MCAKLSARITIRATWMSYLILSGFWILLAIAYCLISIRNPGGNSQVGVLIAGGVAALWITWLRGFRIAVGNGYLDYRDGFFRSSRLPLNEIKAIKAKSVEWNALGRRITVPRILVLKKNGDTAMTINPKPFGRVDMRRVIAEIDKAKQDGTS